MALSNAKEVGEFTHSVCLEENTLALECWWKWRHLLSLSVYIRSCQCSPAPMEGESALLHSYRQGHSLTQVHAPQSQAAHNPFVDLTTQERQACFRGMGNVFLGFRKSIFQLYKSVNSELANKKSYLQLGIHCFVASLRKSENALYLQMPFYRRQYLLSTVSYLNSHSVFKWLEYFRNMEKSGKCDIYWYVRWFNPFIFPFCLNPVCFLCPFHKVEHNATQQRVLDADLCLLSSE